MGVNKPWESGGVIPLPKNKAYRLDMGDIRMLVITILLIGAMIGGFAKFNDKENKKNLWIMVTFVIVGMYLLGGILNPR